MEDKINEILSFLLEHAQNASEFAADQAPLIAQEIILYGRVTSVIVLLLSAIGIWFAVKCFRFSIRGAKKKHEDLFGLSAVSGMGAVIFGVGGFIGAAEGLMMFAKAWFAPRLYLIDYITGIL